MPARVGHELPHAIKLVVAGEDHRLPHYLFAAELLLLNLEMDEPRQDVQKTVPLQNFFPQVGGLIAVGILRVARATSAALVKGQEVGTAARQAGGHIDLVGIDGEMDQRALLELEDQVGWIAVVLVLRDRIAPGLGRHGVLEFHRGDRDSVQAQASRRECCHAWPSSGAGG